MALTIGQLSSLATVGIEASGGVRDSVFKANQYLQKLKQNAGKWSGTSLQIPFNYMNSDNTNGSFYKGSAILPLDQYDPITSMTHELVSIQESLILTHDDLAKNKHKDQQIALLESRLKLMKQAFGERFSKGIFSAGDAVTGALTTDQFVGLLAFLKSSSVNYGGVTDSDVSSHVAYVNSNSGTNRAITTALFQDVLGGASEGNQKPDLVIMKQATMNQFIELLKPYQRTTRESTLSGLGHGANDIVYSGVDCIIDNLSPANGMIFLNQEFVKLYEHPDYNMKIMSKDDLENIDAMLKRVFWKGTYACGVLRYQGYLKDITA